MKMTNDPISKGYKLAESKKLTIDNYQLLIDNYQLPKGYKLTEVGVIPNDWEVKRLQEIATLQRGYDLPHRLRADGEVPVVTSTGVTDTHSEAKEKAPGVVTGRYGTIGEVFFIEKDYWPHNTALFVKDFHGNSPLFISYFLRTIDFQSHSGKSGVPGINRNDLHTLPVAVPSLPEQKAIAQVLSDTDALLEALDCLIAKKRDLKQATMQQLLTGKTRLPEFGEGKEYKQTEIGEIPEDWNIHSLDDLCSAIIDGTHYTPNYVPNGIPFYSVENVTANDFQNTKFISEREHLNLIKRCKPEKGNANSTMKCNTQDLQK
jgi:type I restriction enzyme, S subunit